MAKKNTTKLQDIAQNVEAAKTPISKTKFEFQQSKHFAFLDKLSPHIKTQMEDVFLQEAKIKKQLSDSKQLKMFTSNPKLFFENAKIELSPIVKKRIEAFKYEEAIEAKTFVLPNGETIKPNININIKIK